MKKEIDWNEIIKAYELLLMTRKSEAIIGKGWSVGWFGRDKIQILIQYE